MNIKEKAKQIKEEIPVIMIALSKRQTPVWAKVMAALTVAYALSPIDLIPDFIPVLGMLDDIIILPLLITLTVKLIPREVLELCRREVNEKEFSTKRRWLFAIPIVLIWLSLLIWLIQKLLANGKLG